MSSIIPSLHVKVDFLKAESIFQSRHADIPTHTYWVGCVIVGVNLDVRGTWLHSEKALACNIKRH